MVTSFYLIIQIFGIVLSERNLDFYDFIVMTVKF